MPKIMEPILPILSILGYWAILLGTFGGPGTSAILPQNTIRVWTICCFTGHLVLEGLVRSHFEENGIQCRLGSFKKKPIGTPEADVESFSVLSTPKGSFPKTQRKFSFRILN